MYTQQQSILDVMTPEELNKHAIIMPPESVLENERKTRVIIDSFYRDKSQYPNPNDYYFTFDDDIDDVISAKLIAADVPMASYVINSHFYKLWVEINSVENEFVLPQGIYTPSELANVIHTALDTNEEDVHFNVSYSPVTEKFTFTGSSPFVLKFEGKKNALDSLLGFSSANYSSVAVSSNSNIIVAPFRCNMQFNNYIVMCIDQFDNNKSNTKPLNKSFAIIPNVYTKLNISEDPDIIKKFNPPLARLVKLHITFFDKFGNPYDFQNMDHRLEIVFTSFKQKRKYQNIFGKM
jgi:hypothetical protein|uniref:DUF5901 domain-containing protein n=1 Tax=viral metagenome TaxID=1070528 RepID=A0A6C0BFW0_9ZZZZ